MRCHIHAFTALGGVAREIFYDNLGTAVAEHDGQADPAFFRAFSPSRVSITSIRELANLASGWEKGKVRARHRLSPSKNFWPLREFTDLHDVNRQARQWLAEVANRREHRETRQRPIDRFHLEALRPLPDIPYDYRDSVEALVHKDLRLQFDANRYCVPHR